MRDSQNHVFTINYHKTDALVFSTFWIAVDISLKIIKILKYRRNKVRIIPYTCNQFEN